MFIIQCMTFTDMNRFIRLLLLSLFVHSLTSFAFPDKGDAEFLYGKYCAKCHGINRLGLYGPPLVPQLLNSKSEKQIYSIIKNGLSPTPMPSFRNLSDRKIKAIINFIKSPANIPNWNTENINDSQIIMKPYHVKPFSRPITNLIALVESGDGKVWIIDGKNIINKINFGDIHGGLKFSANGKYIYMPSRNGWIGRYNIKKGYLDYKVRACIYQRNITLANSDVISACWLPASIVILNSILKSKKFIPLKDKISAIYALYNSHYAIFGVMHKNEIGFLNTKTYDITYYHTDIPFEDFFIDPLEQFVVGSSFSHDILEVFSIREKKIVYKTHFSGMPHLASATFWFKNGKFFFATPDIKKPVVTIWQAYHWKKIKEIPTKGMGFFVKTNPNTPYLWADEDSNTLLIINKNTLIPKHVVLVNKGWIIHTQFSGDGKYAYVSDYAKNGKIFVIDSTTLKILKKFSASFPLGKYNYVMYSNQRQAALLGEEVYLQYCWGCHHPTRTAFAPSFKYIAKHIPIPLIRAQILNPQKTYKVLGFKQNVMPEFHLSKYEIDALIQFIESTNNPNFWSSH